MVLVHVYIGTDPQAPTDYTLNVAPADTYQDLITLFINMGGQSGQIYGINGEIINYEDVIVLTEVNYIIPPEPYSSVYIRNLDGNLTRINYSVNGTIRDLYNQVQALHFGRNVRLVLQEEDAPPNLGTDIRFVLSQASKKAMPVLLRGKTYDMETPLQNLQLEPNKVFHLVKYHVAFAC